MSRLIKLILFLFVSLAAFGKQASFGRTQSKQIKEVSKDSVYYTCPMHPEIHASSPGNCPKCGMFLIKKKESVVKEIPVRKSGLPKKEIKKVNKPALVPKSVILDTINVKSPQIESNESKDDLPIEKSEDKIEPHTLERVGKIVRYDLYVKDTLVNFTGRQRSAIAINGSIPAPTLTFTEGDTAEIYVHNLMDEETSVHWHGVFLPNQFDGVPYMTQMPIKPHETFLYKFPVIQNGTYWYHSHTRLQEQSGMYGALIFLKRNEAEIPAIPLVISDWTDYSPRQVNRWLHNATDWFAIQKGSTQSYSEAISKGHFHTKVANEWKRMNAMDVSDVRYDLFLTKGKPVVQEEKLSVGEKVKLRIVNGGASTYFWLTYSGGQITVVANDGNDVQPIAVDRLLISPSETYDVIISIPDNMSYEFLATSEDRTGTTSLWLGEGMQMPAPRLPKLKYFAGMRMMNAMMDMKGNMKEIVGMQMSNQTMDMNEVMYPEITGVEKPKNKKEKIDTTKSTNHQSHAAVDNPEITTLNYGMLKSVETSTLRPGSLRELYFELTGNMNRYVWAINNKTVSESDKILIKNGENVRIVIYNNTMMRHPMHLHGHDFRVLNGQGDYAPLKNVLDIMPMERDTIEFAATESGDWFFHCHILYHMMSGMGKIFQYENSPQNPEIPNRKIADRKLFADDRMVHFMTKFGIESNGLDGEAMLAQTRWKLSAMWHLGYHAEHGYETEIILGRYLGKMQWLFPYLGFDYHYKMEGGPANIFGDESRTWVGQFSDKDNRKTGVAGIEYSLPMLVVADARVSLNGKFRFQISREDIPVSPRLRWNWMINSDKEYMMGFRYILTKYFSLSTHYDSDMSLGVGATFTY